MRLAFQRILCFNCKSETLHKMVKENQWLTTIVRTFECVDCKAQRAVEVKKR